MDGGDGPAPSSRPASPSSQTVADDGGTGAPKPVSFAEVVHAADTTERKLRGEIASLSKLSRRVTPDGKISWPFSVDYRENGTGTTRWIRASPNGG